MESRTKEILGATLQKIASDEQFDAITVKRLVLESHVNRQTFYYHFQDKYDCLQYQFYQDASNLVGDVTTSNWLKVYLDLFLYIDKNQTFFQHVSESHAYTYADDFMLQVIDLIITKLQKSLQKEHPQLKIRDQSGLLLFEYGLQGIVRNWFRGGLRENPSLLVESVSKVSQRQLRTLFHGVIDKEDDPFRQQLMSV
ncbi:TetR/AcrR family transcriptional regulator C-terminal domain-containing protein [Levilactobacillus cerevisiae]|uniref:TetR/AcrR family transcriptional regulator C-terminal domain-containing protein n=1 Tax=Levilactobacillus cerevisiae TaxID=1704076 RepID=UPI000F7AEA6C|nr:TetR/AcrR family transcriptional regulator C-terminal domain-containing protein [Levilactobacillus cerevisiae]